MRAKFTRHVITFFFVLISALGKVRLLNCRIVAALTNFIIFCSIIIIKAPFDSAWLQIIMTYCLAFLRMLLQSVKGFSKTKDSIKMKQMLKYHNSYLVHINVHVYESCHDTSTFETSSRVRRDIFFGQL